MIYAKKRGMAVIALTTTIFAGSIGFTAGRATAEETIKIEYVPMATTEKVQSDEFVCTAYCACEKCCGAYADGLTAIGTEATEGRTIAVDPMVIPIGSKVEIDGIEYIAEDTGGAIKGKRIDIYFDDHSDAVKFGVQTKKVVVAK